MHDIRNASSADSEVDSSPWENTATHVRRATVDPLYPDNIEGEEDFVVMLQESKVTQTQLVAATTELLPVTLGENTATPTRSWEGEQSALMQRMASTTMQVIADSTASSVEALVEGGNTATPSGSENNAHYRMGQGAPGCG